MEYEMLLQYVRPELVILIAVLYFIGVAFKQSTRVPDEMIPILLGIISIFICALYILAVEPITGGYQNVLIAIFDIVVQGILCAAGSVYFNQLYKQYTKTK